VELNGRGVSVRPEDTLLARKAAVLLANGPADDVTVVAYVCNLPSPPPAVAARLASAIFAGRSEFVRDEDGRWSLGGPAPQAPCEPMPIASGNALDSLSFAVVDVETTGTQPTFGDRITEVAIAVVRDGSVTESFATLVNPERPIPAYITRLTNITSEMVQGAPRFGEIAPQVVATLTGHVFTAHNATFDWKFVSAELGRCAGYRLSGRRLCTVRLARKLLPQLPRRSLDYVARYYGIGIENRHRAAGDAFATAHCLLRMLEDARDRGCATWEDLQQLGGSSRRKPRRAPASPTSVSNDTTA
jgi:DNA polymerase III subunit epsilon